MLLKIHVAFILAFFGALVEACDNDALSDMCVERCEEEGNIRDKWTEKHIIPEFFSFRAFRGNFPTLCGVHIKLVDMLPQCVKDKIVEVLDLAKVDIENAKNNARPCDIVDVIESGVNNLEDEGMNDWISSIAYGLDSAVSRLENFHIENAEQSMENNDWLGMCEQWKNEMRNSIGEIECEEWRNQISIYADAIDRLIVCDEFARYMENFKKFISVEADNVTSSMALLKDQFTDIKRGLDDPEFSDPKAKLLGYCQNFRTCLRDEPEYMERLVSDTFDNFLRNLEFLSEECSC